MNELNGSTCETYEVLISTWMDEELEHEEQREVLDHVARCPECRAFFLDSRALEGLTAITGASAASSEPTPEVWQRIVERTAERTEEKTGAIPGWALRAAAVLVLGVALALAPWPSTPVGESQAGQIDVVLEGDRGDMTEDRFLQLTGEILRADRRFHFAMQEVMERVIDDEWEAEGSSSEGLTEDHAKDEGEGERSPFRV